MILTLITVGKMLEARSKGKTTDALKNLMKLAPKTATVLRSGEESVVPIEQVQKGDVFIVRPGEHIPVDGVVLEGSSAINESALTGESVPVDKAAGDSVSAATLNQSGYLKCEATRVGEDTTFSQIIQMVSDAAATKAPVARWRIKSQAYLSPLSSPLPLSPSRCGCWWARALALPWRAVSRCWLSAVPARWVWRRRWPSWWATVWAPSMESSLRQRSAWNRPVRYRLWRWIRPVRSQGAEPSVTDLVPAEGVSERELLQLAYALEQKSEHPLAKAICSGRSRSRLRRRRWRTSLPCPATACRRGWVAPDWWAAA